MRVLGLIIWCLFSCVRADADPALSSADTTVVHLTPTDAANFQTGMASLAEQAHVAIVTEGAPLKPSLAIKAAPSLPTPSAIGKAITTLAAAYDYDTKRVGGIFVLTKRYSDPKDLPCVTLPECRESARNIASLLDAFSPHLAESVYSKGPDGKRDSIVQFFASLSPSQLAAAQAKTLRYGTLSPEQQRLIMDVFLDMFIQVPGDRVTGASDNLADSDKGKVTLLDENGESGLYLALPASPPDTGLSYLTLAGGSSPPGQQNPLLVPPPPPKAAKNEPKVQPLQTLGMLVAALDPIEGQKPVASPAISGKPVTAFGIKYTETANVLRALAALYGLRIGVSASGGSELERPYVTAPLVLRQLSMALWQAIPASYCRALHAQIGSDGISFFNPGADAIPAGMPAEMAKVYTADRRRFDEIDSRMLPSEMRDEAGHQLLAALQPQIKIFGLNTCVPISTLDAKIQSDLAVSLMTDVAAEVLSGFSGQTKQSVMDSLDNMDQTIISTDPSTAANVFGLIVPSFNMTGTDPNTGQQVGLGGFQYFSQK